MRISINKQDPGYRPDIKTKTFRVTVNGNLMTNVLTADDAIGLVVRAITTPEGRLIVNPITKGVATQKVWGTVRIFEHPAVLLAGEERHNSMWAVPRGTNGSAH